MPRAPRAKSKSGTHHIMLQGINQQVIFKDEEDYHAFLERLGKYADDTGCQVYAWCLMPNHVHLLVQSENSDISTLMRKLGAGFVYWYNRKYNRIGSLFQDRFKSEQVEGEQYLLTVLRYIHLNPVKAGMCTSPDDHLFSSYHAYTAPQLKQFTHTSLILSLMSLEEFKAFHQAGHEDQCMDLKPITRIRDDEAEQIIRLIIGHTNAGDFQAMERSQRDEYLRHLKERGLTIRQIERLTGINRGVVQKA